MIVKQYFMHKMAKLLLIYLLDFDGNGPDCHLLIFSKQICIKSIMAAEDCACVVSQIREVRLDLTSHLTY